MPIGKDDNGRFVSGGDGYWLYCPRCDQKKYHTDFARNLDHGTAERQSYCRECRAAYVRERAKRGREERRRVVLDYLKSHPCVDCGETDPVVLEFDHVRGEKKYNIGHITNHRTSVATLVAEIEKCDVRCANCRVRRTAKERGYYRASYGT